MQFPLGDEANSRKLRKMLGIVLQIIYQGQPFSLRVQVDLEKARDEDDGHNAM